MMRLTITSNVISDLHVKRRAKFTIAAYLFSVPRAANPFITPDIGKTGQLEIAGHRRSAFLL